MREDTITLELPLCFSLPPSLVLHYLFSSLLLPTLVQARPVYIPIHLFVPTFVPHDWFQAQASPWQPSVQLASPTNGPSVGALCVGIGFYIKTEGLLLTS